MEKETHATVKLIDKSFLEGVGKSIAFRYELENAGYDYENRLIIIECFNKASIQINLINTFSNIRFIDELKTPGYEKEDIEKILRCINRGLLIVYEYIEKVRDSFTTIELYYDTDKTRYQINNISVARINNFFKYVDIEEHIISTREQNPS